VKRRIRFFVDGVQAGETVIDRSAIINTSNYHPRIGSSINGSMNFDGRMDEFRVSRGVARWTENFTPPSEAYEADAYTVLLLHFDPAAPEEDPMLTVAREISEIMLARPLENLLEGNTASHLEGVGTPIFLANLVPDETRGSAFQLAGTFLPAWLGVSADQEERNEGFIFQSAPSDVDGGAPITTADLVDMNGDRLPDRVYMDTDPLAHYWWVQFNTGNGGFEAPVQWFGVDRWFDDFSDWYPEQNNFGAIRHYDYLDPYVLGDLFDINGDNLPDRVMQRRGGHPEWYVQLNNGSGFDPGYCLGNEYSNSESVLCLGKLRLGVREMSSEVLCQCAASSLIWLILTAMGCVIAWSGLRMIRRTPKITRIGSFSVIMAMVLTLRFRGMGSIRFPEPLIGILRLARQRRR